MSVRNAATGAQAVQLVRCGARSPAGLQVTTAAATAEGQACGGNAALPRSCRGRGKAVFPPVVCFQGLKQFFLLAGCEPNRQKGRSVSQRGTLQKLRMASSQSFKKRQDLIKSCRFTWISGHKYTAMTINSCSMPIRISTVSTSTDAQAPTVNETLCVSLCLNRLLTTTTSQHAWLGPVPY